MKFNIEATWKHEPSGLADIAIIPVFCSSNSNAFDRSYAADSASDEWYYDSATETASSLYREQCLDLDGVDFDDWIDKFLQECITEYHLIIKD